MLLILTDGSYNLHGAFILGPGSAASSRHRQHISSLLLLSYPTHSKVHNDSMNLTKNIDKIRIILKKILAKNYLQYTSVMFYLVTHVFGYISLGKLTSKYHHYWYNSTDDHFHIFGWLQSHKQVTPRQWWSFVFLKTERYRGSFLNPFHAKNFEWR